MRDGVVNILKPPGLTSNDVVYDVRRALSIKKVGHTGTLDPGAGGTLPVCIGKATRLFDYLMEKEKEYIAEVTFGCGTDTLDSYGTVTEKNDKVVTMQDIENALPYFIGDITQIAPMYSAVSIGGERLYKLARRGIEVERKERNITVHGIDILNELHDNKIMLRVRCSKGTYIRTLCADIAKHIGSCGYVSFLLRTKSGRFTVDNAISVNELVFAKENGKEDDFIVPVEECLDFLPDARFFGDDARKKLKNGAEIKCDSKDGIYRTYSDDDFIGIGECMGGILHIKTQF